MAKNTGNDLTLGLSGRVGNMIGFRQTGGDTEAFRLPGKRGKGRGTPAQQAAKQRFLEATYYAKAVHADPVKKAIYKAKVGKRQSAYNLALSDFIKKPEIKSIVLDNYLGQIGNLIHIRAIDDFKVAAVKVAILNPNGVLVEQGGAVEQPGGTDFIYTATVVNPLRDDSKVIVSVNDLAGNVVIKEEFV